MVDLQRGVDFTSVSAWNMPVRPGRSNGCWTNLDEPVPSEHQALDAAKDPVVEEDWQQSVEYCFKEQREQMEHISQRLVDVEFEISRLLKVNGLVAAGRCNGIVDGIQEKSALLAEAIVPERASAKATGDAMATSRVVGRQDLETSLVGGIPPSSVGLKGAGLGNSIKKLEWKMNRTSYTVEKSVYGVIVTPGRTLSYGAWLMLCGHYSITTVLAVLIWLANTHLVDIRQSALFGAAYSVCHEDGDGWDCTPKGYSQLTDFDRLDTDYDGYWSVNEATNQGLLQQFKAIHDVSRAIPEFLDNEFPYQSAKLNPFCGSVYDYEAIRDDDPKKILLINEFLAYTIRSEESMRATFLLAELSEGDPYQVLVRVYWMVQQACNYKNHTQDPTCFWTRLCNDHVNFAEQAKDSELQYREATKYFSVMSRSLHESITASLLKPCRLVSPLLCGNIEVRKPDFMTDVPWWVTKPPDERVQACKSFVDEICPRLFGLDYENLQESFEGTCGDPRIETEEVHSRSESNWAVTNCTNDHELMRGIFNAHRYSDHMIDYYFKLDENELNLTANALSQGDCVLYAESGWCALNFPIGETLSTPAGQRALAKAQRDGVDHTFFSLGQMVGHTCAGPDACCRPDKLGQIGCPSICRPTNFSQVNVSDWIRVLPHASDAEEQAARVFEKFTLTLQSQLGDFTCFGGGCEQLDHHIDNESGNVRIGNRPHEGYDTINQFKIVIKSTRNVRVYLLNMNIGNSSDVGCAIDAMIIDGVRICRGNGHSRDSIDILQVQGRDNEIGFAPQTSCEPPDKPGNSDCTWEILITDRGTPESFNIPFVSFSEHSTYWDAFGKISRKFALFFYLILFVWVAFVWLELQQIAAISSFILFCPDAAPDRSRRVLYMISVVFPRTAIWGFTLTTGVALLVNSESLVECVLNNVALAFILDIDNLLYSLLAPRHLQDHLDGLAPFEWSTKTRAIFHDCQLFFLSGSIVIMTFCIVVGVYMLPQGFYQYGLAMDCVCNLEGETCKDAIIQTSRKLLYWNVDEH